MHLNIQALHKTPLFKFYSDYLLFLFLLFILTMFSLLNSYEKYLDLKRFEWHTVDAKVLSETKLFKAGRPMTRYKLKSKDFTFYTSSFENFIPLMGRDVAITLKTNHISFLEYIKGFYVSTKFQGLYPNKTVRYELLNTIKKAHDDKMIANLYGALFLAEPIEKSLRERLTHLGINHLAAISGFHLGFISFFIVLLSHLIYKPLHKRYLPFRNRTKDVMIFTLSVLFMYVVFLDFTPSLLRAFGMMFIGFILYDRGMKLISFSTLVVTVSLLLALFPDLFFALGFWLSALGVFMLFLILKHFSHLKNWQLFLLLHVAVFILMVPWIVFIFGELSIGQLLSPLLSMLFILFYPLSVLFASVGLADSFDGLLLALLNVDFVTVKVIMPQGFMIAFLGLLMMSLYSRKSLYLCLFLAACFFGFTVFL